jgi:hypothetical protein
LITGLLVDKDRMAANLAAAAGIEAEQQAMADLIDAEPSKEYLGATELIIDLLQTAIYCGVPDANTAFRIAQAALADDETTAEDDHR